MQTDSPPLNSVPAREAKPLRVLYFAPRECWPLNTGAKLRNYHLSREAARRCQVTLLTFSDQNGTRTSVRAAATDDQAKVCAQTSNEPLEKSPAAEIVLPEPDAFYERVTRVARDKGYTPGKILRGALGQTPLPVLNYTTTAMARALAQVLDKQAFDIVQVESIHLSAYLPVIRAARNRPVVILDWHNIESGLMRRYAEHATGALRRIYARRTSSQLARLERRVLPEFDAHIVVSQEEREKLLEQTPDARVYLIENGVETEYYSDEQIAQAHTDWLAQRQSSTDQPNKLSESSSGVRARRALFVGSMDYHANVDAVTHFAREVWPQLRSEHPDLVFTIVGRDPAPEVKRLGDLPGIEVTGTVDDVRPYYHDALMAVIPLRVGGGSRLKILEAMAAGIPVVSTRLGAEGINVSDGANIVLANSNDELRQAISGLMKNEGHRREIAAGGRALVSAQYGWPRLGSLLVDLYQKLARGREHFPEAVPNH